MRNFRFSSIVRKYFAPYSLIRKKEGARDEDGVWIPSVPIIVSLQGHVQPISAELQQAEGGRYTKMDRMLFTNYFHQPGELVQINEDQYTVATPIERDYSDVNQYIIKKVIVDAPV